MSICARIAGCSGTRARLLYSASRSIAIVALNHLIYGFGSGGFPSPPNIAISTPMKVDGKDRRAIWVESDAASIGIIDQTLLPHRFGTVRLTTLDDAAHAIKSMQVRGAPLIGATAAYGVWLALRADPSDEGLERACATLLATRPTAINLKWALDEMLAAVRNRPRAERVEARSEE